MSCDQLQWLNFEKKARTRLHGSLTNSSLFKSSVVSDVSCWVVLELVLSVLSAAVGMSLQEGPGDTLGAMRERKEKKEREREREGEGERRIFFLHRRQASSAGSKIFWGTTITQFKHNNHNMKFCAMDFLL